MPERPVVRSILAIVFLLAVVTAGLCRMYWPLLARPAEMKFFGYLDASVYTGPVLFYGDRVRAEGELPLWNSHVFCGQPIAGNPQYLLFYPPNVLRSLLTPGPTPWNTNAGVLVMLYLHALWAGLGAYWFGRSHGFSRFAAVCTGSVFVLSAAFTQRLFLHHHLVLVVSWVPWAFFFLRRLMDAASLRRGVAWSSALGITVGMSLLAGFPQMAFLGGLALVMYWLVSRLIDVTVPAGVAPVPWGERWRVVARDLGLGALAVAVSCAIAAAQIVPSVQLMSQTPRFSDRSMKIEKGPSVERWDLLEVLSIYLGSENHESVKAIGASGLIVALVGLFSRARRDAVLFAVLSLLLLDASMANSRFMLALIERAAPYPMSSPGRMMMIGVLPLSMLAGLGVDRLRNLPSRGLARLAIGLACLFVTALMVESAYRRLQLLAENGPRLIPPMEILVFPIATFALVCVALWRPAKTWPVLLAATLMIAEPVYWRSIWSYNMSSSRGHFYRQGPRVAQTRPEFPLKNSREGARFPNTALYTLTDQINGYDPLHLRGYKELIAPGDDDAFWRGIIETAKSNNLPHLLLKRPFWLHREYVSGPIPARPTLFPPTTTAYIENPPPLHVPRIERQEVPNRSTSASVSLVSLMSAPHSFSTGRGVAGEILKLRLPQYEFPRHAGLRLRLRSSGRAELDVRMPENVKRGFASLATAEIIRPEAGGSVELDVPLPDLRLSFIEIQPFYMGPNDTLVIEAADLVLDNEDEGGHIRIVRRTSNTVEVEVSDLPGYRILSFIDFDFPGWHASLDGADVPILRAFSHFKAVEVPPGTHRVRFEFRSPRVYFGIAISTVTLAACVAAIAWAGRPWRPRAPGGRSRRTAVHGPARSGYTAIHEFGAAKG